MAAGGPGSGVRMPIGQDAGAGLADLGVPGHQGASIFQQHQYSGLGMNKIVLRQVAGFNARTWMGNNVPLVPKLFDSMAKLLDAGQLELPVTEYMFLSCCA